MKKYRSRVRGPLPVTLKSGSISVASKGYFTADGDDLLSPDLLTKLKKGLVVLVEEVVAQRESPPDLPEGKTVIPEVVQVDKKGDDSLTMTSEMVESKDENSGSAKEDVSVDESESEKDDESESTGDDESDGDDSSDDAETSSDEGSTGKKTKRRRKKTSSKAGN